MQNFSADQEIAERKELKRWSSCIVLLLGKNERTTSIQMRVCYLWYHNALIISWVGRTNVLLQLSDNREMILHYPSSQSVSENCVTCLSYTSASNKERKQKNASKGTTQPRNLPLILSVWYQKVQQSMSFMSSGQLVAWAQHMPLCLTQSTIE